MFLFSFSLLHCRFVLSKALEILDFQKGPELFQQRNLEFRHHFSSFWVWLCFFNSRYKPSSHGFEQCQDVARWLSGWSAHAFACWFGWYQLCLGWIGIGWVGMVEWSPTFVSNSRGIDVLDAHSKPDQESRWPKHAQFADLLEVTR